jgi:hypothetical protein
MNAPALADDGLCEGDERGDAGGEDDEEQPDHHLISGFRIVLLPVPDQGPRGTDVHHAKTNEADHGGDRGDDLGDIPNISEQILNSGTQIHERSSLRNRQVRRGEATCAR